MVQEAVAAAALVVLALQLLLNLTEMVVLDLDLPSLDKLFFMAVVAVVGVKGKVQFQVV
jgi:hypothetical protein